MNVPFNMNYSFSDSLREVPESKEDFQKGIQFLNSEIDKLNGLDKISALSKLGAYQRIAGLIEDSLATLKMVRQLLSQNNDKRLSFITELRIAQSIQFKGDFEEAAKIYSGLKNRSSRDSELSDFLDFVYQHMGKNYFDQQRFDLAMNCFQSALVVRNQKGESQLIESTLFAIEKTKQNRK